MRKYISHGVNSSHFLKLLNTFNLCQHVSFPTQNSGHVLDSIITNASSNLVTLSIFALYLYRIIKLYR